MRKYFTVFLFFCSTMIQAQQPKLRTLEELINKEDPGWPLVQQWIKEAKNKVEVLPKEQQRADRALLQAQVTTRSPMGAIVYESGGILVDNGWIRILGSGHARLNRSLMEWNKGKSFDHVGGQLPFLLVADDVLGGFFAINNGGLSNTDIGKIFYFAPDNLQWESLDLGYTDFITFCFSGDIRLFYEPYYWTNWEKEVATLDGNQGFSWFPPLYTKEGKDVNNVNRRAVPIEEIWGGNNSVKLQLDGK